MNAFTNLELAALRSIFSETPDLAADLQQQMDRATVIKRENTGAGFLTTIGVPSDTPQVRTRKVLGYETYARIHGLEHGLGFVLFIREGRMHLLDGYSPGSESTVPLDFLDLTFEIFNAPIQYVGGVPAPD